MKSIKLRGFTLAFFYLLSSAINVSAQVQTEPSNSLRGQAASITGPNPQTQSVKQIKELEKRLASLTQTIEEIKARVPIETPAPKPADPRPSPQAFTEIATLAINSSTGAVANMEKVFSAANERHNLLLTSITAILAALVFVAGLVGIQQFKHAANVVLEEKVTAINTKLTELDNSGSNIKTRLIDIDEKAQGAARHFDETKTRLETEVQTAKTQLKTVMQDATTNFEALVHTAVAYLNVTHVILARGAQNQKTRKRSFYVQLH
ncbi:MAG: hypothetical protein MN733_40655 [Nitrososphaera sp.]|nr:hypothetical protein [Nitrososphaera sp.]